VLVLVVQARVLVLAPVQAQAVVRVRVQLLASVPLVLVPVRQITGAGLLPSRPQSSPLG
jgi:hypothetical protein